MSPVFGIEMKIYVDADACPVKEIIIQEAGKAGVGVTMVCDTSHSLKETGCDVVTVDKGADSADLKIANLLSPGDLVVTQDYGVAALAMGKQAKAIHPDGFIYESGRLDRLLFERFLGGKVRRAGGRTKGPAKRTKEKDALFRRAFIGLLRNCGEEDKNLSAKKEPK